MADSKRLMRLIHPVTRQLREVPERVLPARLDAARARKETSNLEPRTLNSERGAASLPGDLGRIVRPEAQPRWLLPSVAMITPQYLETILRGALVGNHVFQWQLFDMMEDTWPRLVKNLNELKSASIAELKNMWTIEPWSEKDEPPSKEAEDRARLVEEALFGMRGNAARNENGYRDTLYDILDAWGKGVSVLEMVWEVRETSLGEMVAPASTYWVHPRSYAWDGSGKLGLIDVEALNPKVEGRRPNGSTYGPWYRTDTRMSYAVGEESGLLDLPEDKFIVAVRRARTGHPLGGALLRPLAWWWCASNFSADWLLNLAQIFGVPLRWATHVPGAEQATIDAICDMLQNLGSSGWGAFPAGTNLEIKEPSHGAQEMPQAHMLDRADTQCDLLLLGQTLTTQVRREGGSRALGEVHQNVRKDVIEGVTEFLAETLNMQVVPSIVRLNFGGDPDANGEEDVVSMPELCPSFVPKDRENVEDTKAIAEVIQIAVQSGVKVPMEWALERLNIPEAAEGEELVEMPVGASERQSVGALERGGNGKNGKNGSDVEAVLNGRWSVRASERQSVEATAQNEATGKLVNNVLEELTGVEARWLGGVKPFFRNLVEKAKSEHVTDADFVKAIERARREIPELFAKLDSKAVSTALEKAMGSAVVNGAVRGALERRSVRASERQSVRASERQSVRA